MLNFDHDDTYFVLVDICNEFGVSPSVPIESEEYFRKKLQGYKGKADKESVSVWLREQLQQEFLAVQERPRWIQGPEWPIEKGEPLVFVGQIEVDVPNNAGIFHDATTFYIFNSVHTPPVVIVQQY